MWGYAVASAQNQLIEKRGDTQTTRRPSYEEKNICENEGITQNVFENKRDGKLRHSNSSPSQNVDDK